MKVKSWTQAFTSAPCHNTTKERNRKKKKERIEVEDQAGGSRKIKAVAHTAPQKPLKAQTWWHQVPLEKQTEWVKVYLLNTQLDPLPSNPPLPRAPA